MAEKVIAEKPIPLLRPPFEPRPIPPNPSPPSPSPSSSQSHPHYASQQPAFDTANSVPLSALDSLPTITGPNNRIVLANDDIHAFLSADLDLSRLNRIHAHLWMAGRPMRARPLHRYKMLGYGILHTQQMDLHLLQFSHHLMLKPLPEWLLSHEFWEQHICAERPLHELACGFLLSYVWLLASPIDLKMAHDTLLLPAFVTWPWWKAVVREFCAAVDVNALDQVNPRYQFGDLRLGRINSIYRTRFMFTHFVRGYLYGYNRYVIFFQRNFSWILVVFVFFSLVLSAMQVGTGVAPLDKNQTFLTAAYVFVVFSIVSVMAVLGFVGVIFVIVFFFNMAAAIAHVKKETRDRERLALERKSRKGA
ncbi:hypothetical protein BDV95DRAFT_591941 [Massariosphaeria phaeospora]|uniref:Uncharacterized protein n=1 Tax=Massariosphaeria phaeospora TaxID=100035 RepID=A0A7C8MJZ9_9PLEO|nr:hypothetical protein BDV95DRAFT_591941 [Massariosphaeria phaeospora]